jgi:hypothetical protein
MSIFILNMPIAIEKYISVSALSSKIVGDYFDNRGCGANNTAIVTKRQFIYAPNLWSVKRDGGRTRKKILEFKTDS